MSGARDAPGRRQRGRRYPLDPVFLIFATKGQGGEELNPTYVAAAGEPKELWEIPTRPTPAGSRRGPSSTSAASSRSSTGRSSEKES